MKATIDSDSYLVIDLAMQDAISFEQIYQQTGLTQNQVVSLMRRKLQPSSFRRWRKRVQGRKAKHRKLNAEEQPSLRP